MYHTVSYKEVIDKKLGVMDMEAIEICRDNNIKIVVTNIDNVNVLDEANNVGGRIINNRIVYIIFFILSSPN